MSQNYYLPMPIIEALQYLFCGLLAVFSYVFIGAVASLIVTKLKRSKNA